MYSFSNQDFSYTQDLFILREFNINLFDKNNELLTTKNFYKDSRNSSIASIVKNTYNQPSYPCKLQS